MRWAVPTALLGTLCLAPPASGAVRLECEVCPPVDLERLRAFVQMELANESGSELLARLSPGRANDSILIRLVMPSGDRLGEREMELADLPTSMRPRALALGLAELVRAAKAPASIEPSPSKPPPPPPVLEPTPIEEPKRVIASEATQEPPARSTSLNVQLSARARFYFTPVTTLTGGEAALEWSRWRLSAGAMYASVERTQGRIALQSYAVAGEYALLHAESPRWRVSAGIGGEAGWCFAEGIRAVDIVQGSRADAPTLAVKAVTSAFLKLTDTWALRAGLEAGYGWGLVLTADGQRAASVTDGFVGLSVGVAWRR